MLLSCQPVLLNRRSEHFFLTGTNHQYVKRRLTEALNADLQPLFLWPGMEEGAGSNSGIEDYIKLACLMLGVAQQVAGICDCPCLRPLG